MIRKRVLKKIYFTTFTVFLLFIISCFTVNNDLVNIKVEYQNNVSGIYLLDKNNYLVEVSIPVKNDLLKNIPLIIDNLKMNNIFGELKGLLPNDTVINNYNVKDGILYLDFNSSIFNVNPEIEEKVIESLVYSFLNFKELKGIKISINGKSLSSLPQSKVPIKEILTMDFGINKEYSLNSLKNIQKVVLYYYENIDENEYYVPITKYLNSEDEKIKIIIDNLKNNYLVETNLMSYLNDKIKLEKYEYLNDVVTLSFNNVIDFDNDILKEELIYVISNSIFDSMDVNKVFFMVDDHIYNIQIK